MKIEPARSLRGSVSVPGDKSISHRAIMLGAISEGETRIEGFLRSADCMATIDCMRRLGVRIDVIERNAYDPEDTGSVVIVRGEVPRGGEGGTGLAAEDDIPGAAAQPGAAFGRRQGPADGVERGAVPEGIGDAAVVKSDVRFRGRFR